MQVITTMLISIRQMRETHGKVYACDSIHDDEDICICQLLEAEI